MVQAATRAGFSSEGLLRRSGWANRNFVYEIVLGHLHEEWWSGRRGRVVMPARRSSQIDRRVSVASAERWIDSAM